MQSFVRNYCKAKRQKESAKGGAECEMFIIAGLGNPSKEYDKTRHNVGFDAIDHLADKYGIDVRERKHKALVGKGRIDGERVVLLKPQTFMNLSGESIRDALDFYKVDETTGLIVIYDDISLPPGQLRIRKKGSAGGHNGIKNIIAHLGHDTFMRIKVGVGEKPSGYDLAAYVLGRFSKEERSIMEEAFEEAAEAVGVCIVEGPDAAMNQFNQKK